MLLKQDAKLYWSSHRRCSVEKGVIENFSVFTEKHLCWNRKNYHLNDMIPNESTRMSSFLLPHYMHGWTSLNPLIVRIGKNKKIYQKSFSSFNTNMPQNEMIFFFEISKLLTKHLIKWFHESSEQLFFRQARNERGAGGRSPLVFLEN